METITILPSAAIRPPREAHPPGDLAIWFFILAELLAFAVFFTAYAFARAHDVALFNEMQEQVNRNAGALNTVFLVSASWCVARAVHAVEQRNRPALGARWLAGGIGFAAAFVVVKCFEYAAKFGAGINLSTNTFWMFYLSLTFFHFMHVILGIVILSVLWHQTRRGAYGPGRVNGLVSGAAYWHMVDLVWIVLFPLVYVMR
jgi:nitric oxide reductase NorE protein